MLPREFKDLSSLILEARRFERKDINGKPVEDRTADKVLSFCFILVSFTIAIFVGPGFTDGFISYVSAVLAILVGLFITTLVFSLDKFYKPDEYDEPDSRSAIWRKQSFYFTKKFSYKICYTIALCILALIVLSISPLFPTFNKINVLELSFCWDCVSGPTFPAVALFMEAVLAVVQRYLVIYLFLRVMWNTLLIVGSMVYYMTTKMDRSNDKS